ncbi:MAG: hypothetical protein AMXMBFR13_23930 [Phycisphaerae bacterium]
MIDGHDAAATGMFTYRLSSDPQLESESINSGGGGLYTKLITRAYQASGVTGRSTGFRWVRRALRMGITP